MFFSNSNRQILKSGSSICSVNNNLIRSFSKSTILKYRNTNNNLKPFVIFANNNNNNNTTTTTTITIRDIHQSFEKYKNSFLFNNHSHIYSKREMSSSSSVGNDKNQQQQQENITTKEQQAVDDTNPNKKNENKTLLYRYLNNTYEHYPIWSRKWFIEKSYQMIIFAMTGSSALGVVRFLLKNLWHVEGTVFGGPWQYTAAYFITMFTCYPFVLLFYGTLFGRHQFFKKFFLRMTVGFPQRIMKLLNKNKQQ